MVDIVLSNILGKTLNYYAGELLVKTTNCEDYTVSAKMCLVKEPTFLSVLHFIHFLSVTMVSFLRYSSGTLVRESY